MWENAVQLHKLLAGATTNPVLVDADGTVVAEGRSGESHRKVFYRALCSAQDDRSRIRLIEALANDSQHKFALTQQNGKPLFDENGKRIVMSRAEAGRVVDATGQRSKRYRGTPLQSQQVRIPGLSGAHRSDDRKAFRAGDN
jgi:hypothetical protein